MELGNEAKKLIDAELEAQQVEDRSMFPKVTNEEAKRIAQTLYRYDRLAQERVAQLDDIGEAQVKRYRDQGYVIVENTLSQSEIDGALTEIDDMVHGRLKGPKVQRVRPESELKTPEEREWATRKVYNYVDYAPILRSIAFHEGILSVAEKLLGDRPTLVGQQGLLKPPFGGGEKPWHQDMAYGGLFFKKQILSVWIALDTADLDNGCMHLIPRSHLRGGLPHYSIRDWQMCDHHVDVDNDVAAVMQPGSALFFSGLLAHGTPANFSSKRRRAVQLRYAPASSVLMNKEEFRLMFTGEMMDAEC